MGVSVQTLALAKKYVKKSLTGLGALKGAPCTVKEITKENGVNSVVFEWKGTDNSTNTSTLLVVDGFSPTVVENRDNSSTVYKLDFTTENGSFTTPNLMGASSDLSNYITKEEAEIVIETKTEEKVQETVETKIEEKVEEKMSTADDSDIDSLFGF